MAAHFWYRVERRNSFWNDQRGAVAAILAIALATLIGFAALAVETGLWFSEKRHYQTAADAGAISGAFQLANGASLGANCSSAVTTIWGAGCAEAVRNGYASGGGNAVTITTGTWSSGVYTANATPANAVRAVISEPKNSLLAVLYRTNVTINVSATAIVDTSFGHACILALDNQTASKNQDAGLLFQGSVNFDIRPCAMASNTLGDSIAFQGGSSDVIKAQEVYAAGGVTYTGSPQVTVAPGQVPISGAAPLPDPYQNVSIPSNACSGTAGTHTGSTYSPGVYNGLSITSTSTMSAGTYYVCNGDFSIKNATVTGTGVTVVLTGSPASKIGGVQIGANAAGNISGPDVGTDTSTATYPGFVIIQDRTAPTGDTTNCKGPTNQFDGNASLNLAGTIYTPSEPWCLKGTPGIVTGTNCLQIVAWQVQFSGNPTFADSGCPPSTTGSSITNVVLAQ